MGVCIWFDSDYWLALDVDRVRIYAFRVSWSTENSRKTNRNCKRNQRSRTRCCVETARVICDFLAIFSARLVCCGDAFWLGLCAIAEREFSWHGRASLKAVVAGGVSPLRLNCLAVSSLGYPSVGCSPAVPLTFRRTPSFLLVGDPSGSAILHEMADGVTLAFWKPRLLGS